MNDGDRKPSSDNRGGGQASSAPGFEIRKAAIEDAERLVAFQVAMAWETEALHLESEVVRRGVGAVLEGAAGGTYYVAVAEGRVMACLLILPEFSDWRNGMVWWIHSVYVEPQWRRRGVFGALYAHLKQCVALDDRLKGLRLYVDRRNEAAQRVYQSLGMSSEHYALFEWMK